MIKKIIILVVLIFSSIFPQKKFTISGTVLSAEKIPLENVNVFLDQTSLGSTTDKNGYFEINQISKGNYELVVSLIGFKHEYKNITVAKNVSGLRFYLSPQVYTLDSIDILAGIPERWNENYKLFKQKFLGQSEFGANCLIKNKEVIDFRWNKEFLYAKAKFPLIIFNKSLGYKILCHLKNFRWDSNRGEIRYSIKTRFYDLIENFDDTYEITENREYAFKGSFQHFLISLVNNNTLEEGFKIYLTKSSFYKKLFSQSDEHVSMDEILTEYKNPTIFSFSFDGYLKIIYNRKISWLRLTSDKITLNKLGAPLEPYPFEILGHWADLGVGDMLPKNFKL